MRFIVLDGVPCANILQRQGGRSCAGARGPPPKSLDSDENFKPEYALICRKLRFGVIYALFGDLWAKKVPFVEQKKMTLLPL